MPSSYRKKSNTKFTNTHRPLSNHVNSGCERKRERERKGEREREQDQE